MTRSFFVILLLFSPFLKLQGQDLLILKKDESEIICRILLVNDTIIQYQKYKSSDPAIYQLRRQEVLSYRLDKKSGNNDHIQTAESAENTRLFSLYHMNESVEGYIVKLNGDTLKGIIHTGNIATNQLEVNFQPASGQTERYTPSQIKGYGYGMVDYRSVKTALKRQIINKRKPENGQLFLHIAVDGTAKLYHYYELRFLKATLVQYVNPPVYMGKIRREYFIAGRKGTMKFMGGRSLKGILNQLLSDHVSLMETVNNKILDFDRIPEIIRNYNDWAELQHP